MQLFGSVLRTILLTAKPLYIFWVQWAYRLHFQLKFILIKYLNKTIGSSIDNRAVASLTVPGWGGGGVTRVPLSSNSDQFFLFSANFTYFRSNSLKLLIKTLLCMFWSVETAFFCVWTYLSQPRRHLRNHLAMQRLSSKATTSCPNRDAPALPEHDQRAAISYF